MAGQVPEAYPCIRLCLENALYALFIQDDPTIGEGMPVRWRIWLDRDTNKTAAKKCGQTFSHGNVQNHLVECDAPLGRRASDLYGQTITYGAHPNFYGQAQAADPPTEEGGNAKYLLPNTDASKLCIQIAVDTGMTSLRIFGLILQKRYEEAGIPARLDSVDWGH